MAVDVLWSRAQMVSPVVPTLENGGFYRLEIPVRRLAPWDGVLSVAFATSDGDARGIGEAKAALCRSLAVRDRGENGCGDFERTAGVLTFPAGVSRSYVVIPVTEDRCMEKGSELLLVQLGIPGGPLLQGELFRAYGRIDDDDFGMPQCANT